MAAQRVAVSILCALAPCPALSASCEELVASIEARIRANGVANFTVTAVDVAASAPGKQVGTCDVSRKKIMYLRASSSTERSPASASASASRLGVITECADGRVIREGTCKK